MPPKKKAVAKKSPKKPPKKGQRRPDFGVEDVGDERVSVTIRLNGVVEWGRTCVLTEKVNRNKAVYKTDDGETFEFDQDKGIFDLGKRLMKE